MDSALLPQQLTLHGPQNRADYFAARRDLENNYLKSLQKIAKRSFLSDPSALGPNFLPVYERLVGEIGELASIHGELEKKLEVECELPMRNISTKGDWGRIKEHDDSLTSTLREISTLENQLTKDQKKAEGASGKKASQASQAVVETERNLRQTMELWETEAPFAFEAYQRVDTQRLNLMKEVITKFETARSDAAQRLMSSTEQSMQVVLNFDPQIDMQEFALRNATTRGNTFTSSSAAPSTPSRNTAAATTAPPSSGLARRTSLGASTLLRRNTSSSNTNSTAPPVGQNNGLNEFGGREQPSSASIHSTERGGHPPSASDLNTPSRSSGGGGTLKNALRRFGRGRSNKSPSDMQTVYGSLPEGPEATSMEPPSSSSRGQRLPEEQRSLDSRSDTGAFNTSAKVAAAAAVGVGAGGAMTGSLMAPLAPTRLPSSSTPASIISSKPRVDAEGFSIPPPDRKPWEVTPVNQSPGLLEDDEERDTMFPNASGKMTGMSIAQRPITAESSDQEQAALERMRSTLLTARSPNLGPQRRNTARRDRRDVRNSTFNNSSMNMDDGSNSRSSTFGIPNSSSPITASSPNVFAPVVTSTTGNGKAQSIASMGSMSQIGNQTLDPSNLQQGLNASITERVNVVFSGREISKIMVVGEVSVSARDLASTGPLHLRMEAFEQLEKAAPNPAFLKPIEGGSGQAGEYTLDVAALQAQSQGSASKATLLKYQVFLSPTKWNEYAPLLVNSQWRCEDHQTSILINLMPNAELRSSTATSSLATSIEDVAISVDVTSPTVSNIMSKPNASYSSEQKKLFWKMADPLSLSSDALPSKALARFQVDHKSDIRPVEVRWRIPGLTLSNLGLSIVDSSSSVTLGQVSRQLISGKYLASP